MLDMIYEDSELILFYGRGTTPVAGYRVQGFSMGRERRVHMQDGDHGSAGASMVGGAPDGFRWVDGGAGGGV